MSAFSLSCNITGKPDFVDHDDKKSTHLARVSSFIVDEESQSHSPVLKKEVSQGTSSIVSIKQYVAFPI